MRHRAYVPIVLLSVLMLAAMPARGAVGLIAAGPSSQALGSYATPVVVASAASSLTFLNQDVQPHNVVSVAKGPDEQPWCKFFGEKECPLLWSPVTEAGGRTSQVRGLENMNLGTPYGVYCTIHPVVRGTVIAG